MFHRAHFLSRAKQDRRHCQNKNGTSFACGAHADLKRGHFIPLIIYKEKHSSPLLLYFKVLHHNLPKKRRNVSRFMNSFLYFPVFNLYFLRAMSCYILSEAKFYVDSENVLFISARCNHNNFIVLLVLFFTPPTEVFAYL